ncbi:ABC-three component system protein [Lysinibacillus irui]|uniref:ABC-three component systems C-terminal domain-containing protein n=1 Tax=Lysinibacillus irui TaxID=2998077 RepID=A0AAJ5RLI9_9BACI|nr:ABC-three component system protein [Lysinibacillus irui]WDV06149.1 hypothetical protein OU989_18085 [Lysinibacillus irui]
MVNKIIEKNVEFDATHSWNGFCYQGKVAIIAVIDYIINSIKDTELINQYSLEFEYLEDFSIKKDGKYIQIHQVKSYGIESLSEYKDAIWLLLGKSVYEDYETIEKAYLHAAESIDSKKGIITNNSTLRTVLTSYTKPKSSESLTQMSPSELYNYIFEKDLLDQAFEKFTLYKYSNENLYCTLLEIEGTVKEKIIEYYEFTGKKEQLEQKGLLDKYTESSYVNLLGFIDKHINIRHYNRQNGIENYDKEINLTEIKDILNEEYDKLPKSLYVYYLKDKLIRNFNEYYNSQMQFIRNGYLYLQHETEIEECKNLEEGLNKILGLIKKVYRELGEEEFLLFCHKINPHVKVDFNDSFLYLSELVTSQFMNYPWFQALVDFHENIVKEDFSININNSHYLATTIVHTLPEPNPTDSLFYQRQINANIEATISKIAINILENNKIYKELYKIDYIITGNINKPLKDYIHKTTAMKEYEQPNHNNHILSIKNIDLIDLNECRLRRERNAE